MASASHLPSPDLTAYDISNVQSADTTQFGLADPVTIEWVLYSESGWPTWQSGLVSAGLTNYASGYDGYCFLTAALFNDLAAGGDMLGMSVELPNSAAGDETGFGWVSNGDSTYSGFSYYWDMTLMESTPDLTWLCDAVPHDVGASGKSMQQGYCFNFMPKVSGPGAEYRFSTHDLINVWGWTNFSNSVQIFSLSNSTVLLGAFKIGAQVTAVAVAALALSF